MTFEKLFGNWGWVRKEKSAIPSVMAGQSSDPFSIWRQMKKVDPAKAMEVYTGWVYSAIRAIAMEIGSMEYRLFEIGKDGDEEIFESELLDLLYAVNDYQTSLEMKYMIAAHLESVGNAYLFLEGVNSDTDKPTAMHIMIPSKVRVIVDRNAFPTRIQGYQYNLGTNIYRFAANQVLHIKYPDPSDAHEGIGTVQCIGQWIDADNYAMEFNRRFFQNGATIGGTIESEAAYTPEQLQYLKTSFESAYKGVENAYKVLALPKGAKYTEGGRTQKDLDFANMMLMMRDRILAGFKVPRTVLGITDDVNRANAEATDYVFAARTIKPIMRFITTYLNEFLVPRYGDNLYLDFKDPVPQDRAVEMDQMNKSLGANGATPSVTINEARDKYFGLPAIEGGDQLYIPFSLTPIGTDAAASNAPASDPAAAPAPKIAKRSKRVVKTRYAMNAERRQSITKKLAEVAAAEVAKIFEGVAVIKNKSRKDITNLADDEYEVLYKGFALRVTNFEKRHMRAIQDFNAMQRKEVLANFPNAIKGMKAIDISALFNFKQDLAAFVDLSKPIMYDLAAKEGKEAGSLLAISDMDILTPEVRAALDTALDLMSRSYNQTTLDLLQSKLEQGLKEGLSQPEMADLINGIYEFSDETRALQVARTETFRIANYATQEAWKQSGIVNAQRWYTAADERVCPYCSPMHGKVVGIDDDFFKKGDTVTGSDGSKFKVDYSDVGAPPLHVSCRCYIRPEEITLE